MTFVILEATLCALFTTHLYSPESDLLSTTSIITEPLVKDRWRWLYGSLRLSVNENEEERHMSTKRQREREQVASSFGCMKRRGQVRQEKTISKMTKMMTTISHPLWSSWCYFATCFLLFSHSFLTTDIKWVEKRRPKGKRRGEKRWSLLETREESWIKFTPKKRES